MNLDQLQIKYNLSQEVIKQAKLFEKSFNQFELLSFFVDDKDLIGTVDIEVDIVVSRIHHTVEHKCFSLIVRFVKPIEISIALETPLQIANPIIQPNGMLKSGELWRFTTFDKLYQDIIHILSVGNSFDTQFKEAKKILESFRQEKITEEAFNKQIKDYIINYELIKNYVISKRDLIIASRHDQHFVQMKRVLTKMKNEGNITEEVMQVFEQKIDELYNDIL